VQLGGRPADQRERTALLVERGGDAGVAGGHRLDLRLA
jgi:hypothetical protein